MAETAEVKLEVSVEPIEEIITKLKDKIENHVKYILDEKILEEIHIEVLKFLLEKNTPLLKNLINLVDEITKDNVINTKDIPFLILFIKDLYSFLYLSKKDLKKKSKDLQEMIAPILKYMLGFLIKEKSDLSSENIVLINSIIENTINVLQATTSLKTEKCKFLKFF